MADMVVAKTSSQHNPVMSDSYEEKPVSDVFAEIPDWYIEDGVSVKGNQICIAYAKSPIYEDRTITHGYVFNYREDGIIQDARIFFILETPEDAERFYGEVTDYTFNGDKNRLGMTKENERTAGYYCSDNIVIAVIGDKYYVDFPYTTLFESNIAYWADRGVPILRLD